MVTAKTGGKSRPPMTDKELIKELRTLASFLSQQNTDLKKQVMENKISTIWIDNKGRTIEIHTMSNKWLNNIRKSLNDAVKLKPILDEIKRRKINKK